MQILRVLGEGSLSTTDCNVAWAVVFAGNALEAASSSLIPATTNNTPMAQRPTYFLAPNFTFKPETGPIHLGSIIVDPLRPQRPLSKVDRPTLEARYPRIERFVEAERNLSRDTGHDLALAVWAQFLQSVGPRITGERSISTSTEYTSEFLTTAYFAEDPSDVEIKRRISDPKIQAVMRGDFFTFGGHPVYMITGLKIAKGFVASKGSAKSYAVGLEGTATVPIPIGTVDVGAGISHGQSRGKHDSWKSTEDIVFAYQLLKIKWKGLKQKRLHVDDFSHKHQLLSNDSDSPDEDHDSRGYSSKTEDDIVLEPITAPDLEAIETDGALVTVIEANDAVISIVQDED